MRSARKHGIRQRLAATQTVDTTDYLLASHRNLQRLLAAQRDANRRLPRTTHLHYRLRYYLKKRLRELWKEPECGSNRLTKEICLALADAKTDVASAYNLPINALSCFHHCDGGEYLLDFVWTTYPVVPDLLDLSKRYLASPEIVLAAESEHGKRGSSKNNCALVIDDFCKLLDVKARFKLMIFRSHDRCEDYGTKRLVKIFENVLNQHHHGSDREDWMLFSIPWEANDDELTSHAYSLQEGQGQFNFVILNAKSR